MKLLLAAMLVFTTIQAMSAESDNICRRVVNNKFISQNIGTNLLGKEIPKQFYIDECKKAHSELYLAGELSAESLCGLWKFETKGLRCNNKDYELDQKLSCAFTILYACQYEVQKYYFDISI